jgi:hypothetical protein
MVQPEAGSEQGVVTELLMLSRPAMVGAPAEDVVQIRVMTQIEKCHWASELCQLPVLPGSAIV